MVVDVGAPRGRLRVHFPTRKYEDPGWASFEASRPGPRVPPDLAILLESERQEFFAKIPDETVDPLPCPVEGELAAVRRVRHDLDERR